MDVDAVCGLREPKQDGRLSDPDFDARLADCDTAASCFGVSVSPLPALAPDGLEAYPADGDDLSFDREMALLYFFTRK